MKVCIDPGHGGKDLGAIGLNSSEKDISLKLSLMVGEILLKNNVSVLYTRKEDVYVDLKTRCNIANRSRCQYFISIHCNCARSIHTSGTEVYYDQVGKPAEKLARALQEYLIGLNNNKDRGIKKADHYILKHTKMPAVLLEVMYISNPVEEKKLNDAAWQEMFAEGVASTFLSFAGFPVRKNIEGKNLGKKSRTSIMGEALANAHQMEEFVHLLNPEAPYYAKLYLTIGKKEGVRGDLAFAQAIYETNYFTFNSRLSKDLNQFVPICSKKMEHGFEKFATPLEGIKAHIQHLKAFASTGRLNMELADPCFHLIQRGCAPCWEDLDDKWDIPQKGYGEKIVALWKEMLTLSHEMNTGIEKISRDWRKRGIILPNIDMDKPITWKEYLFLQSQLSNKKGED